MNQRNASALAFGISVAAATLAATAITGTARAETPTIDKTPFVSTRSVSEVRAETLAARLSSAGIEYVAQLSDPLPTSGFSRMEARDGYIAAREEVLARGSELGGPAYMPRAARPVPMAAFVGAQPAQ